MISCTEPRPICSTSTCGTTLPWACGTDVTCPLCDRDPICGEPGYTGSNAPGTTCDDQDPNTIGDVYNGNCICKGTPKDRDPVCGEPGYDGYNAPDKACDDGNPSTT